MAIHGRASVYDCEVANKTRGNRLQSFTSTQVRAETGSLSLQSLPFGGFEKAKRVACQQFVFRSRLAASPAGRTLLLESTITRECIKRNDWQKDN